MCAWSVSVIRPRKGSSSSVAIIACEDSIPLPCAHLPWSANVEGVLKIMSLLLHSIAERVHRVMVMLFSHNYADESLGHYFYSLDMLSMSNEEVYGV